MKAWNASFLCCLFSTELHTFDQLHMPKSCFHHADIYQIWIYMFPTEMIVNAFFISHINSCRQVSCITANPLPLSRLKLGASEVVPAPLWNTESSLLRDSTLKMQSNGNCWCCVWHNPDLILFVPRRLLVVFKKELDKDVAGDTSGNFAKLLLALVQVSFISVCFLMILCCQNWNGSYFSAGQTSRTIRCCRLWKDRSGCQSKLLAAHNLIVDREMKSLH